MKTKILPILVFLTGLGLSVASAFFSIIGLTALFAGAFWSVVIMGSILEIGKLVSVSWLYNNWNIAPKSIRAYFIVAIIALMAITSMGIFGFLSSAHLEQQLRLQTGPMEQINILQSKITAKEEELKEYDKQLAPINSAIDKLIEKGQASKALSANFDQKKNKASILEQKDKAQQERLALLQQKILMETSVKKMEAEVGPLKYVAEFFFGVSNEKILDKTVRFIIIVLIFVFDPLAIFLLLAFNISMNHTHNGNNIEYFNMEPPKRSIRKVKFIRPTKA